ncbi:hypothetical protein Hoch_1244 [Haliangium ochraceum DSM 14365]|uniref:Uncharacterized protein n=1 Tax=Haliangium ochraceum (strain DSM 14365 / JCM 11303 / SMP-2) TaxID=502025 RepID=D0LTB0_HALO1|nr:hypothetical protein Hoch_1244 [Haliangium ochraceum DSM 14365]
MPATHAWGDASARRLAERSLGAIGLRVSMFVDRATIAPYHVPMVQPVVLFLSLALAAGCGPGSQDSDAKPTGTPTDPVEVCERLADVCRIDDSRLGVCTATSSGEGFLCASQH